MPHEYTIIIVYKNHIPLIEPMHALEIHVIMFCNHLDISDLRADIAVPRLPCLLHFVHLLHPPGVIDYELPIRMLLHQQRHFLPKYWSWADTHATCRCIHYPKEAISLMPVGSVIIIYLYNVYIIHTWLREITPALQTMFHIMYIHAVKLPIFDFQRNLKHIQVGFFQTNQLSAHNKFDDYIGAHISIMWLLLDQKVF